MTSEKKYGGMARLAGIRDAMKLLGMTGDVLFDRICDDLDRGLVREARSLLNVVDLIVESGDELAYICGQCACRMGGKWPRGHCATMHVGKCDKCGDESSLASVGDWDWPGGKRVGMRD